MKKWLVKNKYILWYALCFLFVGIIDQRKGSAEGQVQMIFTNLTGPVIFAMLIPSVKKEFWKWKGFKIWLVVAAVLMLSGCIIGDNYWSDTGQWYTAVLNVVLISGGVLYMIRNRQEILENRTLNKLCFSAVILLLVLMCISVHKAVWPLWFLGMFGCFYLIGIPESLRKDFFVGMLYGLIVWFFVQQTLAFGFRPYDWVRYRGLYNLETPNGIFYMIIFCAFLCLWLQKREEKANRWIRMICYILMAGCVSFIFLTGGRSALVGAVAAGIVGFMGYDIIFRKSFKHWLVQGIALGLCSLLLLPAVYGCVRYLPTILHHPIWFEGDYDAETSVHSYDPWNSEKYITFDEVIYYDMGRILEMFGIQLQLEDGEISIKSPLAMVAQASEPGDSPDNPFVVGAVYEDQPATNAINIRKTIYLYVWKHLNFRGHEAAGISFWVSSDEIFEGHTHNMFLQIAYNYGIIPGVIFLLWNLCCFVRLLLQRNMQGIGAAVFLIAILAFGCTEMAVMSGQITLTLLFILYYFGMRKEERKCS